MALLVPAWTRVTGQRRVKASIRTSMVHREHGTAGKLRSTVSKLRFAGWAAKAGCWLNWTWPTRGWEKCTRLGGADFARVAPKTRDKRGEEGEGAAVFRRITLDRVRWTRLGCLRSRNRTVDGNLFVIPDRHFFSPATSTPLSDNFDRYL